ncbi:MAG: SpoIIE family protein phosphatase, partial [Thermoanaerobaculia bacterium]|nr:SpoIIE family protein phosphatase [Thermoanaerobaculia bacterium]
DPPQGLCLLYLANALVVHPGLPGDGESFEAGPVDLLLAEAAEVYRLRERVRLQSFQESYRLVELEAVYDVGLAIASTLNLDELSEGILLRAVSLSDARRGALYLRQGGEYRLQGTIGGDALPVIATEDPALATLLSEGAGDGGEVLLPGARHTLAVPIEIDSVSRGLLAIADKESREGVGPFAESDRRTLGLFANQAAIALENAYLHRQALEKERLEREMELAAEIQGRLLPKGTPEIEGCEVAGWNRPAWQVGGDYFDYLRLADERLGLVVADVTGKGLAAALLVSTLHSALQLLFDGAQVDDDLVARLNEHIVRSSSPNKFITMILAEVDPATGSLRSLNAGHNPGLLVRADGEISELMPSGMPLGLLSGSRYRAHTATVEKGDLLCLYSDGITECAALDDEEYGQDRLEVLLREQRDRPLDDIVAAIADEMGRFSEGRSQSDDQTVVLLRRTA